MFERFAQTRAVLDSPKNKKAKRFVETSVAANGPLLERILKKPIPYADMSMYVDTMLKQTSVFGTRMPKNFLVFAREVSTVWDSITPQERTEAGLSAEFCAHASPASAFFSLSSANKRSMGTLLESAQDKKELLARCKLLLKLRYGEVPFESVQDFFLNQAKEALLLGTFEDDGNDMVLIGSQVEKNPETGKLHVVAGKVKRHHINLPGTIARYSESLGQLKGELANCLIVGYSPVVG